MKPVTAQNALNFLLSDRCTFRGDEFGALLEVIKDLQEDMKGGNAKTDSKVSHIKAETREPSASESS